MLHISTSFQIIGVRDSFKVSSLFNYSNFNMDNRYFNIRNGFSLIEMLLVLLIVNILSTIKEYRGYRLIPGRNMQIFCSGIGRSNRVQETDTDLDVFHDIIIQYLIYDYNNTTSSRAVPPLISRAACFVEFSYVCPVFEDSSLKPLQRIAIYLDGNYMQGKTIHHFNIQDRASHAPCSLYRGVFGNGLNTGEMFYHDLHV